MSEQLSFDRKKGFIALPVEVLELDLSPGAFRLLAELCRMANEDGFCWPSLAQLGERLGRSRSSVSGYIKDLREVGLITTQEQQMANGYNYRLKYRVSFWKAWRASISRQPAQKNERSVQPTERILKDKNQNHKNHSPAIADECRLDILLAKWSKCVKGAAYPNFSTPASTLLTKETANAISKASCPQVVISTDIVTKLHQMWEELGVACSSETIVQQAHHILGYEANSTELAELLRRIKSAWAHHWRNPPTFEQFKKLTEKQPILTNSQKVALLKTYSRRWDLARNTLQPKPLSDCLEQVNAEVFVGAHF